MKYIKNVSKHEILREFVKSCEVLFYSWKKVFECCRRYWRSASNLAVWPEASKHKHSLQETLATVGEPVLRHQNTSYSLQETLATVGEPVLRHQNTSYSPQETLATVGEPVLRHQNTSTAYRKLSLPWENQY